MINVLMGIDVGTTSTKVVLFDFNGNEIARSTSHPYQNFTPKPGWVEQDPEELWQALISTMRDSILKTEDVVNVTAICMAVQSGSLIPADSNGKPVYPLITWLDGRAEDIVKDWKASGIQNLVKPLSGWSLYPGLCLPTIAWLKKNNPVVSQSTA
jgi:sugar (pentulose or hexulose) kinase